MEHFDLFTPIAVVLFFTLLTTLRYSFTGTLRSGNPVLNLITNPSWLYPLIISGPYVLGAYYHGKISPWPPTAFATIGAGAGFWAGVTAAIAAGTADVWLLWATATTFRKFSPPHDARMVKYYYVANFLVGAYLMARFTHVIDMGQAGIIPG
jgi:hypothetical protein